MNKRKSESGQVLVLATLAMAVLMGMVALTVDVGFLWSEKRHLQTAADAAAIAGATALRYNQSYSSAANGASTLNGFTNSQSGATVTVANPPTSGAFSGDTKYVEVIVKKVEPTWFLRFVGYNSMDVSARGVASSTSSSTCMYALDPTANDAIHTDGGDVITSTCGLMVDSKSATAITSAGNIIAPSVGVAGGYTGTITTPNNALNLRSGIAPVSDPLSYLQAPTIGTCNATYPTGFSKNTGTWTLSAGTYCGGFTVSNTAKLILNPGTYVVKGGGINLSGNAIFTGAGVTIYNTGTSSTYKPIQMLNDNGTVDLSAPTSGPLAGILFFQDRAITSAAANTLGGGAGKLEGALYFPTTSIVLNAGQSTNAAYTIVVAKTISVQTNAFSIKNDYSSLTGGSPLKSTSLYE